MHYPQLCVHSEYSICRHLATVCVHSEYIIILCRHLATGLRMTQRLSHGHITFSLILREDGTPSYMYVTRGWGEVGCWGRNQGASKVILMTSSTRIKSNVDTFWSG